MGQKTRGRTSVPRKTCSDIIALLTEYVEGALAPQDRTALERHLGDCAACTEYLRSLRATSGAVGRLRSDAIPAEVRHRLRAFLALRPSAPRA